MQNLIEMTALSFIQENDIQIFDKVNLSIPKGKITAILGPSGSGKTTLLRLIGGQLQPNEGKVTFLEQPIHGVSRKDLYRLRKKMGMLCQSGGLFTHLNVYENVAFPIREHTDLSESLIRNLVLLKLQMVGLRGIAQHMPTELSGGMARRVSLARAMALDPELMLYDEPFTGQDPISMGVLMKLIQTLNQALGLTTVIVSHDVAETLAIADQVYVIANQKIIGEGSPKVILNSKSKQIEQFIKGLPDGPVPFDFPAKPFMTDLLEGCS